jgi:hypothetical protein
MLRLAEIGIKDQAALEAARHAATTLGRGHRRRPIPPPIHASQASPMGQRYRGEGDELVLLAGGSGRGRNRPDLETTLVLYVAFS